jgi:hypothetical protein
MHRPPIAVANRSSSSSSSRQLETPCARAVLFSASDARWPIIRAAIEAAAWPRRANYFPAYGMPAFR